MTQQEVQMLKSIVRNIPDFPVPGIQFKDLTTLFKDPASLKVLQNAMIELYDGRGVTKVVGIESRGFIGGSMLAVQLGAGFVPVRKPGKLPAETIPMSYEKAISTDDVVVIHDDLLATGGTMKAAYELVKSMSPAKIYINFICGLSFLNGRDALPSDVEVTTLFDF